MNAEGHSSGSRLGPVRAAEYGRLVPDPDVVDHQVVWLAAGRGRIDRPGDGLERQHDVLRILPLQSELRRRGRNARDGFSVDPELNRGLTEEIRVHVVR